jgi:phosphatidylserine/phosphatidylglycerophosphate/cardiolipin synthase-like enzyme
MKAFGNAQKVIYIEDQYFVWEEDLLNVLLAAVNRGVQIVVLTQEQATPGYSTYQHGMITPLRKACESCMHVFVRSDRVYVHTKVVIVDDVYMTVGSNNINYRSMTYDTELSVAVVDSEHVKSADGLTVGKLAHKTRVDLWAIETEIPAADLESYTIEDAIKVKKDLYYL